MGMRDHDLAALADKRYTEWLARQDREARTKAEAAMARLRNELGIAPEASLWEYIVGRSSPPADQSADWPLQDEAADAIDGLFQAVERVLVDGERWEPHFKPSTGSSNAGHRTWDRDDPR